VLDDEFAPLEVRMSRAKLQLLRALFVGRSGSEIFNQLAIELPERFGITISQ
jgi:hypothetical protein